MSNSREDKIVPVDNAYLALLLLPTLVSLASKTLEKSAEVVASTSKMAIDSVAHSAATMMALKRAINVRFFHEPVDTLDQQAIRSRVPRLTIEQFNEIYQRYKAGQKIASSPETENAIIGATDLAISDERRADIIFDYLFQEAHAGCRFRNEVRRYVVDDILKQAVNSPSIRCQK